MECARQGSLLGMKPSDLDTQGRPCYVNEWGLRPTVYPQCQGRLASGEWGNATSYLCQRIYI